MHRLLLVRIKQVLLQDRRYNMSVTNPGFTIARRNVIGEEAEWVKMFDPPTVSPATPDEMAPTNPVPEVMAAAGFQKTPSVPHTVMHDLLRGLKLLTWDGLKEMAFMTIGDSDNLVAAAGTWPALTVRVPRGVVFHAKSSAHGPPPHTLHWHGIEPTPINDGVGHCSMEIGTYVYQWQPNFIGTYFVHCHRNTVQHFEFGLYGMVIVETPDAYFATQQNPAIPIGAGRDGLRRTAANVAEVLLPDGTLRDYSNPATPGFFPGFNRNPLTTPDPLGQFPTDPHAMTIPYDVEALWVFDDRDSRWSDLAPNAFATFPRHGDQPGVNDEFHRNPGADDPATAAQDKFFAFNDYHADYFYVTSVPVPAPVRGTATINPSAAHPLGGIGGINVPDGLIPAVVNSGVAGTQIAINVQVGQTILIRALDAAYAKTRITFPVDVVIIAWDGRALGVPPFTGYNKAHLLPANTPIITSVARRFDALIRATVPITATTKVEFLDSRGDDLLMTALIPLNITAAAAANFAISGRVTNRRNGAALAGVTMTLTGAANTTITTDANGIYSFPNLANGTYIVRPSQGVLRFRPASLNVTINGATRGGQNFQGA